MARIYLVMRLYRPKGIGPEGILRNPPALQRVELILVQSHGPSVAVSASFGKHPSWSRRLPLDGANVVGE